MHRMRLRHLLLPVGSLLFTSAPLMFAQDSAKTKDDLVWPNATSKTNSDDWLRLHHNEVRKLKPQVLVLNFVNGLSNEEATGRAKGLASAIREATRYHGYSSSDAEPYVDYQLLKVVNLTDETPLPDDQRKEGNSSHYPRIDGAQGGQINLKYNELFTSEFGQKIGISAPGRTEPLTLDTLISRGIVHEVWIVALEGGAGRPAPTLQWRQGYNAEGRKIAGKVEAIGADGLGDLQKLDRTFRIVHINPERGSGCALEHWAEAYERAALSEAIPYLTRYYAEFSGNDLKKRYKVPFNSLGERGERVLEYPSEGTLVYKMKGEPFRVSNYVPVGGSIRFAPNSRREMDLLNKDTVLTTLENYRLKNGSNGADKAERWTMTKLDRYRSVAPDCVGPWAVYWGQSLPGVDTKATDDTGRPMKNWWTFLFY